MKKLIIAFTLSLMPLLSFAMDGNEIIKKASLVSYYAGEDGMAQMLMTVYGKNSRKPLKKLFYIIRKDLTEGGEQLMLTYFVKPSDIKRTTFLVRKSITEDDYRRLYIPASDKVLPIAGSRKQDPFMGSDFSYEDVSGRHFEKDNHKLIGEESFEGKTVYVVESTPKSKDEQIAKMKSWVLKSNFVPVKVDFYNHDGKIYKKYSSKGLKMIQGIPTIMKRTMTSPLAGTKTDLIINPKKVKYNLGLKESLFTERSLKNPPVHLFK